MIYVYYNINTGDIKRIATPIVLEFYNEGTGEIVKENKEPTIEYSSPIGLLMVDDSENHNLLSTKTHKVINGEIVEVETIFDDSQNSDDE